MLLVNAGKERKRKEGRHFEENRGTLFFEHGCHASVLASTASAHNAQAVKEIHKRANGYYIQSI